MDIQDPKIKLLLVLLLYKAIFCGDIPDFKTWQGRL